MASINIMKLKASDNVAGLIMHNDSNERLKHDHANVDIDKSKTDQNFAILDQNYSEKVQKLNERLKELDSTTNTNKRKDRIIALAINVPSPEGIERNRDELNKFFVDALQILSNGKMENVISADVHYDEIHDYIDPQTHEKKSSKPHMHVVMIPEVDGKLNAKYWTGGKKVLSSWQKKIDDLAKTYGAKFLTGEQKNHHKTVEQLKNESEIAEKNKLISEQNEKISEQKIEKNELENRIKNLKTELKKLPDEEKIKSKLEAKEQADDALKQFNKRETGETGFWFDPVDKYGKKSLNGKKITLPVEVVNQLQAANSVVSDALYAKYKAENEKEELEDENSQLRIDNSRLRGQNGQLRSDLSDRQDQIEQLKIQNGKLKWDNDDFKRDNETLSAFKNGVMRLIADIATRFIKNDGIRYSIAEHLSDLLPPRDRDYNMKLEAASDWEHWNGTRASIMAKISPLWCQQHGVPASQAEAKRLADKLEEARLEQVRRLHQQDEQTPEEHNSHAFHMR